MIDGLATLARGRALAVNGLGQCLNFWWLAAGTPHNGHTYATAWDAYNATTRKRHTADYNPPAGYPVWLGPSPTRTDKNKNAGDICWSAGGGMVWVTDGPAGGRTGLMSIPARVAQTRRPYYGWTEDFWNQDVAGASVSTASLDAAALEGADMPTAAEVAAAVWATRIADPDTGQMIQASDWLRFTEKSDKARRDELAAWIKANVGGLVWDFLLEHTVATDKDGKPLMTRAGDLLRFDPAEHNNDRAQTLLSQKAITDAGHITAGAPAPVDVDAIAAAAADAIVKKFAALAK